MASRIIHMTICKRLSKLEFVKDQDRFLLGHLLPDAIVRDGPSHTTTHFKRIICEGTKKVLDFHEFFRKYEGEILNDSLYLGYYLHLIQDAIYRKFIYYTHNMIQYHGVEFGMELHKDYALLNKYLIAGHHLGIVDPKLGKLVDVGLYNLYPFTINEFLEDMALDFSRETSGSTKHLTEEMVDDYIDLCVYGCGKELNSIFSGSFYSDPMDYTWDR